MDKCTDLLWALSHRRIIWFHQAPHISSPNPAVHACHFYVNEQIIPLKLKPPPQKKKQQQQQNSATGSVM